MDLAREQTSVLLPLAHGGSLSEITAKLMMNPPEMVSQVINDWEKANEEAVKSMSASDLEAKTDQALTAISEIVSSSSSMMGGAMTPAASLAVGTGDENVVNVRSVVYPISYRLIWCAESSLRARAPRPDCQQGHH
eukprot:6303282-Amphidinium_carterae.1